MATPRPGAIRAGLAFVELFADDSQLVRGLRSAQRRLIAFGTSVQALGRRMFLMGSAVLAPLVASTRVFASMGDSLAKMSQRTGISVEALSELGYAAEQSGTDIASLEGGIRRMQRMLTDAAQGSRAATDELARLGLSVADLADLTPDQQFALLADRLSRIQDPALRAASAMRLFGRGGAALLPLMRDGAAGIEALRKQARDLGLTISTEDAQAAEVFSDRLSDLWKVIKVGVFSVGASLAPVLQDYAIQATRAAKLTADWIKENRALIGTVFKVAAGVTAAGLGLIALGKLIAGIGLAAKGAAVGLGLLAAAIKLTFLGITLLSSPLGLIIAALGVATFATLRWMGGLETLRAIFGPLGRDALRTLGAITDALASGDFKGAAELAWLGLRLAWAQGTAAIESIWIDFRDAISANWLQMFSELRDKWLQFTAFIQRSAITLSGLVDFDPRRTAQRDMMRQAVDLAESAQRSSNRRETEDALREMSRMGEQRRRDLDRAVADLRAAWQQAIARRATRPGAQDADSPAATSAGGPDLSGIFAPAGSPIQRQGTFSGQAARIFASPERRQLSELKQITSATKETAKNTEKSKDALQNIDKNLKAVTSFGG